MNNIIVGYLIGINILSMLFMYIEMRTDLIKLKPKIINLIYTIIAIIGGSVGILVTSQLFEYKREEKIIKRGIPFIIFVEVVVIGFFIYKFNA